jgi:uncharacterized protein YukE
MADEIAIDPDLLRSHAGRVEQVAGDVAMAKDAAGSINLGGGAFGLMCAFLVPPASVVSAMAQAALSSAGSMVQRSAREIRGVATDFERTEDDIEQQISRLESQLGK